MPAYNAAATISESIESVQSQDFDNWELLVIDDTSDDNTTRIVSQMKDSRIHLLPNVKMKGAAGARNTGLDQAKGRYIAFLDADDLWHKSKLSLQVNILEETHAPLTYAGFYRERNGKVVSVARPPARVDYATLLNGNVIGCLTAMYDTRLCGKVPMPLIRRRHDFALWLQLLKAHGVAHGITEPLATLRLSGASLSANKLSSTYDTWRMYRDVIGLPATTSFGHLCRHLGRRVRSGL